MSELRSFKIPAQSILLVETQREQCETGREICALSGNRVIDTALNEAAAVLTKIKPLPELL